MDKEQRERIYATLIQHGADEKRLRALNIPDDNLANFFATWVEIQDKIATEIEQ